MKPYIGFNTPKRKEATNDADKNFLIKMNNSVYGKTMENMRKRIEITIVKNEKIVLNIFQNLYMSVTKYLIRTWLQLMKRKYA